MIVAAAVVIGATAVGIYNATTDANEDADSRAKEAVVPEQPERQVYYPLNPYDFHPNGLVRKVYVEPGSGKNGGIIKWEIPGTKTPIFEWNEDVAKGAHYHAFLVNWQGKHLGPHIPPGSVVEEPWKSMYF